jgi:hypothetical protein
MTICAPKSVRHRSVKNKSPIIASFGVAAWDSNYTDARIISVVDRHAERPTREMLEGMAALRACICPARSQKQFRTCTRGKPISLGFLLTAAQMRDDAGAPMEGSTVRPLWTMF